MHRLHRDSIVHTITTTSCLQAGKARRGACGRRRAAGPAARWRSRCGTSRARRSGTSRRASDSCWTCPESTATGAVKRDDTDTDENEDTRCERGLNQGPTSSSCGVTSFGGSATLRSALLLSLFWRCWSVLAQGRSSCRMSRKAKIPARAGSTSTQGATPLAHSPSRGPAERHATPNA